MQYEILIINEEVIGRSAKKGDIVTAYPSGHAWKLQEKESRFTIIAVDLPIDEITEIVNGGYMYDFTNAKFVHIDSGQDYDNKVVLKESDKPPAADNLSNTWANDIDPDWLSKETDVCKFLKAPYLDYQTGDGRTDYVQVRAYWFKKFRTVKDLAGMKAYLAVVLYGDYGLIGKTGNELPKATRRAIWKSPVFTAEDKAHLHWIWRI